MYGWTLFDAMLGGDAVELLGIDWEPPEDEEEAGDDVVRDDIVLADYAEILQAHRRNRG